MAQMPAGQAPMPAQGTSAPMAARTPTSPMRTTMGESTPLPAVCGDETVDPGELCDGSFDGTCEDFGLVGGPVVLCTEACGLDLSGCVAGAGCGNGTLDPGEECDDGGNASGDGCSALCRFESSCDVDAHEPDDAAEAPRIAAPGSALLGLVAEGRDVFAVESCGGGVLSVDVISDDGAALEVWLSTSATLDEVAARADRTSGLSRGVQLALDGEGEVFVVVDTEDRASCATYDLLVHVGCDASCADDAYEDNDSLAAATPADRSIDAVGADLDAFVAPVNPLCTAGYRVTTSSPATVYHRIGGEASVSALGARDNQVIEGSNLGGSVEASLIAVLPDTSDGCGAYYVGPRLDCCPAPEASADAPVQLGSAGGGFEERVVRGGTSQYFAVPLCAGGTITATADTTVGEAVAVSLLDEGGRELVAPAESLSYMVDDDQIVFVVASAGGACSLATIDVATTCACTDDGWPDPASLDDGELVEAVAVWSSGAEADVDRYRMGPCSPIADMEVRIDSPVAPVDVRVVTGDGDEVAAAERILGAGAVRFRYEGDERELFAEVRASAEGVCAPYWFEFANHCAESSCSDGLDENGDGRVDCADRSCAGRPGCIEVCADGVDNDADGSVDCLDSDCVDECVEVCDNGVDDDGDGEVDCRDLACRGAMGCYEVECSNGLDDDGDGRPDCRDPDCDPVCFEVCGDGVDNDADGQIDCLDSACRGLAECAEVCDDGVDNDGDGVIDCWDVDCAGLPECVESECSDRLDNDGDGAADCRDRDCAGSPWCVEICDDGLDNDHDNLADCLDDDCRFPDGCGEVDESAGVDRYATCENGEDDDFDGAVDCADTECAFALACREDCGADGDLNGNGLFGCDDPACRSRIECGEADCDNGIDDDGDGHVDCRDPDCAVLAGDLCVETECRDGIDNNGVWGADCQDPDCDGYRCDGDVCSWCEERNCTDGIDDDLDGLVDCDDPECQWQTVIVPLEHPRRGYSVRGGDASAEGVLGVGVLRRAGQRRRRGDGLRGYELSDGVLRRCLWRRLPAR